MTVLGPYRVEASQVTTPIREGSSASIMARIVGAAAAAIQQADVASISQEIWSVLPPVDLQAFGNWRLRYIDPVNPERIGSPDPLTVSAVIFDTLQTDADWTTDETGYNFRVNLAEGALGTLEKNSYPKSAFRHIEYELVPDVGAKIRMPFELELLASLFGKG